MKSVRQVDAYETKDEARQAQLYYAELLVQRGDAKRFGVFIRPLGRSKDTWWGVFLRDRLGTEDLTPASKVG